jgi:tRNA U34 5-carboxymethylaminomethyl modifying enzyme MnmG/GidA
MGQVLNFTARREARLQQQRDEAQMRIDEIRLFDGIVDAPELRHCQISAIDHGIDEGLRALKAGASFRDAWNTMLNVARQRHGGAV